MHQGGVRLSRAMLIGIATAGFFAWGFCVSAISPSDIVINKVQITGGVGKTSEDIVSIYNASSSPVDLNGLRLVKRTKTGTSDTTLKSWVSPTLINPGAVYTWANSSNGFAESIQADTTSSQTISDDNGVALRIGAENSGEIIDSLAWGESANIFVETSPFTTNPVGGQYIVRKNNTDTNNNSLDFEIYPPVEIIPDDNPTLINPGDIRINELVSDPETGDEWIELYNTTETAITSSSLTIEDGSGTKTNITETIGTGASRWFVISKPKGSLNNAGDSLVLKDGETIIDSMSYGDWDDGTLTDNALAAEQPYSLARKNDGESSANDSLDFVVTSTVTKGAANIITVVSEESDDTTSSDGYDYSKEIIISELFPNPKGIDTEAVEGEFIEIYNKGVKPVFLTGWRFELNGVSFPLPEGTSLAGKSYLSFPVKNKLPLANDGATLKLFQPLRQTSYQSITYKKATEGQSYANFISGGWQWTSKPTPGVDNLSAQSPKADFELIDEPVMNAELRFDSSDSFGADKRLSYLWDFGDDQSNTLANPTHIYATSGKFKVSLIITNEYGTSSIIKTITIPKPEVTEKEKDETNSKVKAAVTSKETTGTNKDTENGPMTTAGTVVSLPGTHGTQYFYFLPEFGEPLYQIYNSKKLFPKLSIGDQLIVTGEYTERPEGPRLKTNDAKDIQVIGEDDVDKPAVITSTEIKLPPYPRLAFINGEVVSKKWPRVFLADATGEIELYFTTGTKLKSADFTVGDQIAVTGVLTLSDGKPRLQPRDISDIEKLELPAVQIALAESTTPTTSVLPESVTEIAPKSRKNTLFLYLLAIAVILIGVIGYVLQKKK